MHPAMDLPLIASLNLTYLSTIMDYFVKVAMAIL